MGNRQVKPDTASHEEKKEHTKETVLTEMNEFRKNGNFCDVTITVKNMDYPAHKSVLAAFSPYFKAMFSGEYAESRDSKVTINDIETNIMEMILEYAYTANIEISAENVQALLQSSNIFQAASLFEACGHFLEKQVSAENCLGIYNLADMYNCTNLREKAKSYYLTYFHSVSRASEFLELSPENLIDIISNDNLNAENEEAVFEAVLRWLWHKEERRDVLPKVLVHVRLALLSPYFLHDRVETLEEIKSSPPCMRLVEEAYRFIALPFRRVELHSGVSRPRKCSAEIEGVVIFDKSDSSAFVKPSQPGDLIFISADGQASKKINPPAFDDLSMATFLCSNRYLFVAKGNFSGQVWRYDSKSDLWHQIASMSRLRNYFGFASVDGYLYAVGGWDCQGGLSDSVERYDQHTNSWTQVAPLPVAVHSPAVVTLRGIMYVLGGNNDTPQRRVQRYDPRTNTWTELTQFPTPRIGPMACALHDSIYLFGRSTDTADCKVEIYNILEDEWESAADVPGNVVGALALDGRLAVVTTNAAEGVVCYEPFLDSWQIVAEFPGLRPSKVSGPLLAPRLRMPEKNFFTNINGVPTITLSLRPSPADTTSPNIASAKNRRLLRATTVSANLFQPTAAHFFSPAGRRFM